MKGNRHRQEEESHENQERWLLTYADLITLLLIFFIVMYTMAKLDVAKYEIIKESLSGALKSGNKEITVGNEGISKQFSPNNKTEDNPLSIQEQAIMEDLEQKLLDLVEKYNLQNFITVTQEERGLDIEIRNELLNVVLFDSGSAELNHSALDIMTKIGDLLLELPNNHIRVEGHTDNVPISNKDFNSNWELSTGRSTNVVTLLIGRCGLNPTRLSAVGYGEYKPVASNDTLEGKAKNRRVNIVIIKNKYSVMETKQ